jgi:hypothetical protein
VWILEPAAGVERKKQRDLFDAMRSSSCPDPERDPERFDIAESPRH